MFVWYMAWTPFALSHGQNPLLTSFVGYPHVANLMWNTSILLPAFILWPVTAALGPLESHNLLMMLALVVDALCAFLALRRFGSNIAAWIGGLLYGFSPALVAQDTVHAQIAIAAFPPLALLLTLGMARVRTYRGRTAAGAVLGIAAAAQLLTGTEMLAITAIGVLAGVVALRLMPVPDLRRQAMRLGWGLAAASAVFVALSTVPLAVLLFGPGKLMGPIQPHNVYVQDLAGLVIPGPYQRLNDASLVHIYRQFTGNAVESSGYLGLPLLLLVGVFAAIGWRRPAVRWASITGLILLVLALGPWLHVAGQSIWVPLPWLAIQELPLLESVLPGRLMVLVYFCLALVIVSGIDAILRHPSLPTRFAGIFALVLVAVTLLPVPMTAMRASVPSFFLSHRVRIVPPGSVALVLPLQPDSVVMVWQAEAGLRFRTLTGRVLLPSSNGRGTVHCSATNSCRGTRAPSNVLFTDLMDAVDRAPPARPGMLDLLRRDIRRDRVTTVIAGPPATRASRLIDLLTHVMGRPPVPTGGVLIWARH